MLPSCLKLSITEFAVDHVRSCPTGNWYIPTCMGLRCRVDVIIFLLIRVPRIQPGPRAMHVNQTVHSLLHHWEAGEKLPGVQRTLYHYLVKEHHPG